MLGSVARSGADPSSLDAWEGSEHSEYLPSKHTSAPSKPECFSRNPGGRGLPGREAWSGPCGREGLRPGPFACPWPSGQSALLHTRGRAASRSVPGAQAGLRFRDSGSAVSPGLVRQPGQERKLRVSPGTSLCPPPPRPARVSPGLSVTGSGGLCSRHRSDSGAGGSWLFPALGRTSEFGESVSHIPASQEGLSSTRARCGFSCVHGSVLLGANPPHPLTCAL